MIIEKASIKGYYQGKLTGQHTYIIAKTRMEIINSLLLLKSVLLKLK